MNKFILKTIVLLIIISPLSCLAQLSVDSFVERQLSEITVIGKNTRNELYILPKIVGTTIYAGKKNNLIVLDNVKGNVASNTMRQIMGKIPGIHVWESEGSGVQIGVAARGLSPNRSWEFNVRQNGYDIAADPYGYPEAYYNPQLQAVQRIEIIRGHGSIQYGPQFGGMINYLLKDGKNIYKPFQIETQQTVGSYGLFNTYNAIGGNSGKINYYAFFDHRKADGWRANNSFFTNNGFATFTFSPNKKLSFTTEVMMSHQRVQQPGGLTDSLFHVDLRQSLRNRNWMDIFWKTISLAMDYKLNDKARINIKTSHIQGDRSSLGYLLPITVKDSINAVTGQYNARILDIDQYNNFSMEARFLFNYGSHQNKHVLSGGIRYYYGNTQRYKDGKGTNGIDYNTSMALTAWPKNIQYQATNVAFFMENMFQFKRLVIIPGIRFEKVNGKASGINGFDIAGLPIKLQEQQRSRAFFLMGLGAEYQINKLIECYGNFTQAYRPMQFSDLTAAATNDKIDPTLKDANGFNTDIGIRGKIKNYLSFDISLYHLQYNRRIGSITQQNVDGSFYSFRTNVGDSRSDGIESFAEYNLTKCFFPQKKNSELVLHAAYNYNHSRYGNFKTIANVNNVLVEKNYIDKKVENAPSHLLRSGFTYFYKSFSVGAQYSYVSEVYSDANNTLIPTANGQNGLIPSYQIVDLHATYSYKNIYHIKLGLNNLANEKYFTRRSGGYPGPGLLPAEGRSFFATLGIKF